MIDNVLDAWAVLEPKRILVRSKLHLLTHTAEHIRNNGPIVGFSTEVFECWNAVFCLCSVLSNHQAPSHDIVEAIAQLERFEHQKSGGWWQGADGTYVCGRNKGEGVYADSQRTAGPTGMG